MKVDKLLEIIGSDFYTGVPDSQLKALINHLMGTYGIDPKHHVIAANEGNCAALDRLHLGVDWLLYGDEKTKDYPVNAKMVKWLKEHPEKRMIIEQWMEEEKK